MKKRPMLSLLLLAVIFLSATACTSKKSSQGAMAGYWMDNAGNSTTIQYQDGQYVAVTNYYMLGARSQNTLISSSYANDVLTWKYCPPTKPCITLQTVELKGDTLDVTWKNDNGETGTMTLTRTDKGNPWQ